MRVLVVGGGGREHALAWKIRQSPLVEQVYCAPGNAGIAQVAELVPIAADDVAGLLRFARERGIDLTVVGPELPLTLGIADEFAAAGLRVFGPTRDAARLESSKAFAKEFMRRWNVPTGYFSVFDSPDEAKRFVAEVGVPIVVKADGLAAGKGVIVCHTMKEAEQAIDEILVARLFGDAGSRVVVEEYLEGEEVSFILLTDGVSVLPFPSSQDHKRLLDGDQGPNTGGMGAYSPTPALTPEMQARVMADIVLPTIHGLRSSKIEYCGVLYAGLMLTEGGPKVLEFNARFGDPECQPLMMRLQSDLVDLLSACVEGRLHDVAPLWDERAAACVVLAAAGYPGAVEKGRVIYGLDEARELADVMVFHAGTARRQDHYVTNGGRVLGVTALGRDVADAVDRAYAAVSRIHFDGMQFRRDIGRQAIKRTGGEGRFEHGR
ncbi:MAG: phosphoribosylamine--glycine ligase [Candidatus Binatia bacterium]|nr:phosphoribosylamine--glycine ligase [Candidatus Binatia bacterium]